MSNVVPELQGYDFSDAWLLELMLSGAECCLRIDARNLLESAQTDDRVYNIIDIKCVNVHSITTEITVPVISQDSSEIASVDDFSVTANPRGMLLCLILDYGTVNVVCAGVVVTAH